MGWISIGYSIVHPRAKFYPKKKSSALCVLLISSLSLRLETLESIIENTYNSHGTQNSKPNQFCFSIRDIDVFRLVTFSSAHFTGKPFLDTSRSFVWGDYSNRDVIGRRKINYKLHFRYSFSLSLQSHSRTCPKILLTASINPGHWTACSFNKPLFSILRRNFPGCCSFSVSSISRGNPFIDKTSGTLRFNSSESSASGRKRSNQNRIEEIVDTVGRGGSDMELMLDQMNLSLSPVLLCDIFCNLSNCRISAIQFFNWVNKSYPSLVSSEILNQFVNNLGCVSDYKSMLILLNDLSLRGHCLTEKAFAFVMAEKQNIRVSVVKVLGVLKGTRGSCLNSGIYMLIKVLCSWGLFELAVYVMEETAKKLSYYNVLIAAKCKTGNFNEALDIFIDMKAFGCNPSTKSYNLVLGGLCKSGKIIEACELLDRMEELGYFPDEITFEVLAFHACKLKRMDIALEFLHHMMLQGLHPRITTHAAFIKGYFWSKRVPDAYKYVVTMSDKDKYSANMNYSLLASLLRESGRVIQAQELLVEMIDKGMKPNFPVYIKVLKDLHKMHRGDLVAKLKTKFLEISFV